MSGDLDDKKQRLKDEFTAARGYWSPIWDDILDTTPEFFEAYMNFSSVPWKTGTLDPKVRELIYIAIDSSTTHMYAPGLKVHIRNALKYGATKAEIMEVYQLVSVLGIHTLTFGLPVLLDEARNAGRGVDVMTPLTPYQKQLKKDFSENRGYWSPLWDGLIRLAPEFFEAYLNFSSVPWKTGTLEPKVRELIYIAVDSATTHMYEPGLRVHIQNALKYGATVQEIMEVYQLTAVLGIHTVTFGMPALIDELARAEGDDE